METTQTIPTSVFDIYIKKNADNIHLLKLKASFGATAFLFHSLMSLSGVTPLPKHTHAKLVIGLISIGIVTFSI